MFHLSSGKDVKSEETVGEDVEETVGEDVEETVGGDVEETVEEEIVEETVEEEIVGEDVEETVGEDVEEESSEKSVNTLTIQKLNAVTINEINKTGLHSKLKKVTTVDGCYKANDIIGVLSNNIERDKRLINDYDEDEVVVKKTKCGQYMRSARFFTQKGIERYLSEGKLFSYENTCSFFKVPTKNTNYLKWNKQFEKIKECDADAESINAESDDEQNAESDDEQNAESDDEQNAESDDEQNAESDESYYYCYDNETDSESEEVYNRKTEKIADYQKQTTYKTNLLLKWLFDKRKACKQLGTITTVANVLEWLDDTGLVDSLDKRKIEYLKSLP